MSKPFDMELFLSAVLTGSYATRHRHLRQAKIIQVNHTGDRGGCLVKVKQVPQSALQVADSIALRPQRAEC
ncbi:hypothetical protein Q8X06_33260, partial [Pseudomonas aeruginosa]|nr:hypothetical protein [Pseudomonas aeruginosa]